MEIANEFDVSAPPDRVYSALLDFERLGSCIPGAKVGPLRDDGSYAAEIAIRLGPMRLNYRGSLRLRAADETTRSATMIAEVKELRGQGSARADMSMTVAVVSDRTRVSSITKVEMNGRAAQMGAGIVEDVAARLVADMARNLEALLERDEGEQEGGPTGQATSAGGQSPAGGEPTSGDGSRSASASLAPPRPRATGSASLPTSSPQPIGGFRLLARALWDRLRRRLRPSPSRAPETKMRALHRLNHGQEKRS